MRYIPSSPEERRRLLRAIGLERSEQLFDSIPAEFRLKRPLALPDAMAEADLAAHLRALSRRKLDPHDSAVFLGAGAYRHFIPSVGGSPDFTVRVLLVLHALPARDQPGDAAGDLRVPDAHLPAHRASTSPTRRSTTAPRRWRRTFCWRTDRGAGASSRWRRFTRTTPGRHDTDHHLGPSRSSKFRHGDAGAADPDRVAPGAGRGHGGTRDPASQLSSVAWRTWRRSPASRSRPAPSLLLW